MLERTCRGLGSGDDWLLEEQDQWGTLTIAPKPAEPGKLMTETIKTERGDYRAFYANVRDAVLGAASLDVQPEAGFAVIRLLEFARERLGNRTHLDYLNTKEQR